MIADFPRPGEAPVGGPQVAVSRLVPRLLAQGLDVVVVAPDPTAVSETTSSLDHGGTLVTVPSGSRWTLPRQLRTWRRNAADALRRHRVELAHGQGLLPGGIAAAEARDIPIVVTARGNARADTAAEYGGPAGRLREYLRNRLAEQAVERADVVIGVNPDWRVNIPRRPKRFVFIPNMVDDEFFDQEPAPEPGRVLFAGGGMRAIKGWELLAEAWPIVCERLPEARLSVVGWPEGAEIGPELPSRYRQTVLTEPWLRSAELAASMARAAAVVIPSQFEVSPIVLAEAWSVGVPVVAVPVGGIPALADGAALLVERSPAKLAAGILAVLRGDHVEELVAEGRLRAEWHRADAVVAAHVALYEELLGGRPATAS
jgi:glycosyltransferase involved in cell wall biosynthesis